jgi:predicted DNA-binding transcriptional regulator
VRGPEGSIQGETMDLDPNAQIMDIVSTYFKYNPDVNADDIVRRENERNCVLMKPTVEAALKLIRKAHYSCAALEDVHRVFAKWFEIEDMNRIDVVLAVALSQKMKGTPLWLIIVAPSGDMKSEQLIALDDDGITTKLIHKFTDKTLVNGNPDKKNAPDLAPKLDGKIMLIIDMAEILQLRSEIKSEIWAQLRELYDGNAGMQSGMGTDISYKGIRVTFLGASTPAIDEQILIHHSLGTRELVYRPKEITDENKLMDKVMYNEKYEAEMREELKMVCQGFLACHNINDFEISPEVLQQLKNMAQYLRYMRATGPTDSYSGDLRGFVTPEMPTRVLKQLKRLYACLKSLDNDYPDDRAMEIIKEVVDSSVDMIRVKVLNLMINENTPMTTSKIASILKIGKKSAKTELNMLWNMGLVNRDAIEQRNNWGAEVLIQEDWSINDNHDVIKAIRGGTCVQQSLY